MAGRLATAAGEFVHFADGNWPCCTDNSVTGDSFGNKVLIPDVAASVQVEHESVSELRSLERHVEFEKPKPCFLDKLVVSDPRTHTQIAVVAVVPLCSSAEVIMRSPRKVRICLVCLSSAIENVPLQVPPSLAPTQPSVVLSPNNT